MWKLFQINKPIQSGVYYCYGIKSKFEKYSRFVAYWDNENKIWSDKDGEDLIGINQSVEYWFDINLVNNPNKPETITNNPEFIINSFENVVKPVIKFLADNYDPHVIAIIENNHAQLVEGIMSVHTAEFID